MGTLESTLVTLILAAMRVSLECSATLLAGIAVAAWLRTRGRPETVDVLFRGSGFAGFARTLLVAMAAPLCSLGVLPVLRELRRLGLTTPKLVVYALAAPLLNPLTLVYGLSTLAFTHFLLIVLGTLTLTLAAWDVSSRWAVSFSPPPDERPVGLTGGTRVYNAALAAGRIATGWVVVDLLLAIIGSGLTAALLRPGLLQEFCRPDATAGAACAAPLVIPQYVSPALGVMHLSALAKASLSLNTGFVIYLFGVGMSAASLVWLGWQFGVRRIVALGLPVVGLLIGLAAVTNVVLPEPFAPPEETHGLDALSRPYHQKIADLSKATMFGLAHTDGTMRLGAVAAALLIAAGLLVRLLKVPYRDDDPDEVAARTTDSRWNIALSMTQIAASGAAAVGLLMILSVYVFYPNPDDLFAEMRNVQADAVIAIRSDQDRLADSHLATWDSLAARLPLAAAIRLRLPSHEERTATRKLRDAIQLARADVQAGRMQKAATVSTLLLRLLRECEQQYTAEGES